jgi:hypothetical protein
LTGEPRRCTIRLGGSLRSQLALGRLLVALAHSFVTLTLREVDHPVTALARFRDGSLDFYEALP